MMHLAVLPNWDSLDSVRLAHRNLEAAGLAFFALLVVAEVLAHTGRTKRQRDAFEVIGIAVFGLAVLCEIAGFWYGNRNDELSAGEISSLSSVAKQAKENAAIALTDSGSALTKSGQALIDAGKALTAAGTAATKSGKAATVADNASKSAGGALAVADEAKAEVAMVQSNIAKVDAKYAGRTLSKANRAVLITALRDIPVKPQETIEIYVSLSAPDGAEYADEIVEAFNERSTGWKAAVGGAVLGTDAGQTGVVVVVNSKEQMPAWTGALWQALKLAGIEAKGSFELSTAPGKAQIRICRKN